MTVLVLAFITVSVLWQSGGWLHPEPDRFLVDHNDPDRSFLSKVICPHVHDARLYQGRELSHFLEFFDARFILWCCDRGIPHFYSIVNFLLFFILSLAFCHYATRYLQLNRLSCTLLLGLFWTTPCIFFSGVYFRDAKQGTAVLLFFVLWFLLKQFGGTTLLPGAAAKPAPPTRWFALWMPAFLFSLGLCFMDRQGFFFTAILAGSLLLLGWGPRFSEYLLIFTALTAALVLHTAYSRLLAPALIRNLTGFEVSFGYQELPWDQLFVHPLGYLRQASALLADNFRYFFGNLGGEAYIPIVGVCAGTCWLFHKASRRITPGPESAGCHFKGRLGLLFLFWVAAVVLMYVLMLMRLWVLVWPDMRTFYHWTPTAVLSLLAAAFALHCCTERLAWCPRWAGNIVLALALLANLKSLPEHRRIQEGHHLEGYMCFAPSLLEALREVAATPPGALPLKAKFDTRKVAFDEGVPTDIKNPLTHPGITVEEFADSSHFYNFMRSRRNLDFRQ